MPSIQTPHDQFSLLRLKSGKFDLTQQDTSLTEYGRKSTSPEKQIKFELPVNVPPKPYLSIIDLNQLTRGSLKTKAKSFDG